MNAQKFSIGDRVSLIHNFKKLKGNIRYIGNIATQEGIWNGVELDTPDGTSNGKNYFSTSENHAIFCRDYNLDLLSSSEDEKNDDDELSPLPSFKTPTQKPVFSRSKTTPININVIRDEMKEVSLNTTSDSSSDGDIPPPPDDMDNEIPLSPTPLDRFQRLRQKRDCHLERSSSIDFSLLRSRSKRSPLSFSYQGTTEKMTIHHSSFLSGDFSRRTSFKCRRFRAQNKQLIIAEKNKATDELINSLQMKNILLTEEGKDIFRCFLKSIACDEMLDFIEYCEVFTNLSTANELRFTSIEIVEQFIVEGAPQLINISAQIKNDIIANIESGNIGINLFDECISNVYSFLEADTFHQFKQSQFVQEYLRLLYTFWINEFRTSEKSYIFMFEEWNEFFLDLLSKELDLPQKTQIALTNVIPQLYALHKDAILPEIYKTENLAVVFDQHLNYFFSLYEKFISKYAEIMQYYNELHNNKPFRKFIENVRLAFLGGKDPVSYMVFPIRRFVEYIHIFNKLASAIDYQKQDDDKIDVIIEKLSNFLHKIGQAKLQELTDMTEVLEIQNRVKNLNHSILIPNRNLLRDITITAQKLHKLSFKEETKQYRFYLFNDIFIYTNLQDEVKTQGILIADINIDEKKNSFSIIMKLPKHTLAINFQTEKDKIEFLEAFNRIKVKLPSPNLLSINQPTRRRRASLDNGPLGPVFTEFYHPSSPISPSSPFYPSSLS